jgi:Dyp-type peroxidase family
MALAPRSDTSVHEQIAEKVVRVEKGATLMPVDLAATRIDHRAEKYQKMLENLQGNILKGHGRNHAVHLCVGFTAEPRAVATWMRDFAQAYVTSARQQLDDSKGCKKQKSHSRLFGNLFLTAAGYEHLLGLTAAELERRFGEDHGARVTFRAGMESAGGELHDLPPSSWDVGYRGRRIHAMILLADNDPQRLQAAKANILYNLKGVADVLTEECGAILRNGAGKAIEHFGYVDGRSQPLFFKQDLDKEAYKAGITTWEWDPAAPLGLVLVPDPNVDDDDCFGSYLVFRKLEQNVKGFKTAEQALARAVDLPEWDQERAGAMAVGRFRDGTPVTLSQKDGMDLARANNFTYADDTQGLQCPFQAHIRKVNPRGDTITECNTPPDAERGHRIVRRGITYGRRRHDLRDAPEYGVGLLFMCFQRSIANQFALMQRMWAGNPCFVKPATGRDPIIGPRAPGAIAGASQWPVEWGKPETKPFDFGSYVTLKGGEFFFAPSIRFLTTCCSGLSA